MSAAELEALALQAEGEGAAAPADDAPGVVAPAEPQAPGNFEAIGFLCAAFREVGSRVLGVESLHRTLADRECETLARVLAPVADKYGLRLGGYLGGPEAVALMTAGPILWRAWQELDAELKARKLAKTEPTTKASSSTPSDGGE